MDVGGRRNRAERTPPRKKADQARLLAARPGTKPRMNRSSRRGFARRWVLSTKGKRAGRRKGSSPKPVYIGQPRRREGKTPQSVPMEDSFVMRSSFRRHREDSSRRSAGIALSCREVRVVSGRIDVNAVLPQASDFGQPARRTPRARLVGVWGARHTSPSVRRVSAD